MLVFSDSCNFFSFLIQPENCHMASPKSAEDIGVAAFGNRSFTIAIRNKMRFDRYDAYDKITIRSRAYSERMHQLR
jgi:hypothetical protein